MLSQAAHLNIWMIAEYADSWVLSYKPCELHSWDTARHYFKSDIKVMQMLE